MKNTKSLLNILGRHKKTAKPRASHRSRSGINSTETQLTLYELGALIVVAGTEAGFDVHTEYPIKVGKTQSGRTRHGNLDCAWLVKGNLKDVLVAWELDARDVRPGHLQGSLDSNKNVKRLGNALKFKCSSAKMKIQALYSIRGHLLLAKPHAANCFRRRGVEVWSDAELMEGKLMEVVQMATALSRQLIAPRTDLKLKG